MVILCTQNTCEHGRYPPSKVEFCRNILSQNISVKSYLFLTEHQTCTVFEGEGGEGGSVEFYMMCAGSSEPSLVANSISTQISYAGSNFACACGK